MNLRIPGPTTCPPEVLEAMARPMFNHRGPEFKTVIERLTKNLKTVLQTQYDVLCLTSSGTGALEAAVVNTLSPGDRVLGISNGLFGDRFALIAESYGAHVQRLTATPGWGTDPQEIRQALQSDPDIKAVLVTHNETSTGISNELAAIAQVVKDEFHKLLLVDAVSSVGCIPLATDEWKVDVVATATQKGLMTPPGISIVAVSPQAWEAHQIASMPRSYFDFSQAWNYLERGQTPWTPSVSVLCGLDVALQRLIDEGLQEAFQRHANIGAITRNGVKNLGLELFAHDRWVSDTVTAVKIPPGIDGAKLVERLRNEYNIILGGGQQGLQGKIFRIGHMGYCFEPEIQEVLDVLGKILPKMGFSSARSQ